MSDQRELIQLQQLKNTQRGKTVKAVIVTIIALVWLVFIDPTDVFPVVGWIDDGGLLYCAWKCIQAAVKYKDYVTSVCAGIDYNITQVENKAGQLKKSVKRVSDSKRITNESIVENDNSEGHMNMF